MARTLAFAFLFAAACAPPASTTDAAPAGLTAPQSGGTRALLIAVSPVSERIAWASGAQGTWLRTTDGGATWRGGRVMGADSLQFRDVHAVDSLTAFLLSIGNGSQSRVYRTADGGVHWDRVFTNPDSAGFLDCFDFWDARRGLVIGDAVDGRISLFDTEDGGRTWRRVDGLPAAQAGEGSFAASGTCVETVRGGHAWVVMNGAGRARLLRTSDYGRTWTAETLPITARETSGAQSVTFRDARHGAVLGGGYGAQPGDVLVATTDDGGDSWTPREAPAFKVGSWGGAFVPGARTPTLVAVSPNGIAVARVGAGALAWTALDTLNHWSLGIASPRAGWAVGTQGRITRLELAPR